MSKKKVNRAEERLLEVKAEIEKVCKLIDTIGGEIREIKLMSTELRDMLYRDTETKASIQPPTEIPATPPKPIIPAEDQVWVNNPEGNQGEISKEGK
jgi:ubiquitin-protein ligase